MKAKLSWILSTSVLGGAMWTSSLHAQVGLPSAAGAAGGLPSSAAGVAAGVGTPGDTGTIWSRLGISQKQREVCRRKICATPLGQLLSNARRPFTALTGGIIPPFCPQKPSAEELADPGAVGAAAKVKADEAEAAKRKAAVRFLGTVDCNYWPEAKEALIAALREDRNECVRLEAALALGKGCCCTKETIAALTHAISCSNKDGGFIERSDRVRIAAMYALQHCLSCYNAPASEEEPEEKEPPKPEAPESSPKPENNPPGGSNGNQTTSATKEASLQLVGHTTKPAKVDVKTYYANFSKSGKAVVTEARKAMAAANKGIDGQLLVQNSSAPPSGSRSLSAIIDKAFESQPTVEKVEIIDVDPRTGRRTVQTVQPNTLFEALYRSDEDVEPKLAPPVSLLDAPKMSPNPVSTPKASAHPMVAPSPTVDRSLMLPPPATSVPGSPPTLPPTTFQPYPTATTSPRTVATTPAKPTPVGQTPTVQTPAVHPPVPRIPVVPTPMGQAPVVQAPVVEPAPSIAMPPVLPPKSPTVSTAVKSSSTAPAATTLPQPQPTTHPKDASKTMTAPPGRATIIDPKPVQPTPSAPVAVQPKPQPLPTSVAQTPSTPSTPLPAPAPTPVPPVGSIVLSQTQPTIIYAAPTTANTPSSTPNSASTTLPAVKTVSMSQPNDQLMRSLTSGTIRERETAVKSLTSEELRMHPQLLDAVLKLARQDANVDVRKASIQSLVRCQMVTPQVMETLRTLSEDAHPMVRTEAAIALARLKSVR